MKNIIVKTDDLERHSIDDAKWNNEYANLPTEDGEHLKYSLGAFSDQVYFLPFEGPGYYDDKVMFKGVYNLRLHSATSIMGSAGFYVAVKQDEEKPAYVVYAVYIGEQKTIVIEFK